MVRRVPRHTRTTASRAATGDDRGGDRRARERIIVTAEQLFAERGYAATSTARVATAADVPESLVFYYFATKLELLLAIVRERPTPQDLSAVPRPGTVRTLLERAVVTLTEELHRHRHTRAIIFREAHLHPEIQTRAEQLVSEATAALAAVLADADDVVDAPAVVTAVAGLAVRSRLADALLLPDPAPIDPVVLDVLANAISTADPGSSGSATSQQ